MKHDNIISTPMVNHKNRYELALDAAAVEMGYDDYLIVIMRDMTIECHTRAAEIFAMGFAEWVMLRELTIYDDEPHSTEQLLTLYNNS